MIHSLLASTLAEERFEGSHCSIFPIIMTNFARPLCPSKVASLFSSGMLSGSVISTQKSPLDQSANIVRERRRREAEGYLKNSPLAVNNL